MKHPYARTVRGAAAVTSTILVTSIILATSAGTATALSAETTTSSLTPEQVIREAIIGSSNSPLSGGSAMQLELGSLAAIGSANFPLPDIAMEVDTSYPLPVVDSITQAAIVDKVQEPQEGERVQRWFVDSPAMGRTVQIQVRVPLPGTAPGPMLYLLNGIDAPDTSSWVGGGHMGELADDNVTMIMPTQARASLFADWDSDDPALGRNKWETFLAEELPPLLEAEDELNFNGKRGIGGLSMGADAAVYLANAHPDLYTAVMGISGVYSTLDPLGYQTNRIIVESRGGDIRNVWGEGVTDTRIAMDTVHNPEGLRNQTIFLATGTGAIREDERESLADDGIEVVAMAAILEMGTHISTRQLDEALRARGITQQKVLYREDGVHNWDGFREEIPAGWAHIRPALM